jgi:hypothetical protein
MSKDLTQEEIEPLANFVFKGTVQKLKAATMEGVPVTNRTLIVRVDEIVEAPDVLTDFAGREITVELDGAKKLKQGEQAIFHTSGWIFGEGLAVRALSHSPAMIGLASFGVAPGNPVENLENKKARLRYEQAKTVVTGRVTSVRLPPAQMSGFAAAAGGAEPTEFRPISEHDPVIQEAVVEVDAVHKGETPTKQVKVRFPSSTDVQWYKAPKFRPGQQGFFMLHKEEGEEAPHPQMKGGLMAAAMVSAEDVEDTYTALHPADFQPLDQLGGVRNMILDTPEVTASTSKE